MKTPMQELIEQLKKERDLHGYERGLHYETAIELAEAMLEKEKEVIMDAYWDGCHHHVPIHPSRAEDYFNKTFKTKER